MQSTGSAAPQKMDQESIETILSELETTQAKLHAAASKLSSLQRLQSTLKLTEEFLVQASDTKELPHTEIFNLRASKHPLPNMQLLIFQQGDHERRLAAIDVDTSEVPDGYICPVLMSVINEPVMLESSTSNKENIIKKAFESEALKSILTNPLTRAELSIAEKTTISKAYQNIISAYVRVQEIKQHLIAREKLRREQLALLPECAEKSKVMLSNTEFLQQCGITLEQIPERYISPQFQQNDSLSARTVYTFPVMIETGAQDEHGNHHPANRITVCFLELLKYQDCYHQISADEQKRLVEIQKRMIIRGLKEQKNIHLKRVHCLHREDEVFLDYNTFCVKTDYEMKREAVEKLTYDDIRDSNLFEFINPFTGKPLECIEIDYHLMHELDMFLMNCHFEQLETLRKAQIELAHELGDCGQLHHSVRLLEEAISFMEQKIPVLNSKLETALLEQAINHVRESVSQYNEKAAHGDLNMYIHQGCHMKYLHAGKSYADVLAESAIEVPAHLPLGLIPNCHGDVRAVEFMTHPVRLDGDHVIDFDTLLAYWKKRPAFLGIFGGRDDLTGMNPFTGKPLKSIIYDKKLKAEIDSFMMEKGFFEKAKSLTVIGSNKPLFGISTRQMHHLNPLDIKLSERDTRRKMGLSTIKTKS